MKTNIKNYTSAVSVERTISLIEQELVKIGANEITKSYTEGTPTGIIFSIKLNGASPQILRFCIPTNAAAAFDAIRTISAYRTKKPAWLKEQAQRTAWRIVFNWVQAQVAMVQLKQAEALEVFLPYLYDQNKDETFYEKVKASNYTLLLGSDRK